MPSSKDTKRSKAPKIILPGTRRGARASATAPRKMSRSVSGGTVGCVGIPTVASPTFTCNVTYSSANLDSDLGATSGCLFVPGGGSVCNVAP